MPLWADVVIGIETGAVLKQARGSDPELSNTQTEPARSRVLLLLKRKPWDP